MTELLFDANAGNLPEIRFTTKEQAPSVTGLAKEEFSGASDATLLLRENGRTILWSGLGNVSSITESSLRHATAVATRALVRTGHTKIAVAANDYSMYARAIAEGAIIGSYRYNRFKTKDRPAALELLVIPGLDAPEQASAKTGLLMGEIVNRVRDNTNAPGNHVTPDSVATIAEDTVRRTGATMTVMEEFELKEKGFGGLTAVGAGSANPPRLILLEREIDPKWPTVAIVGKTITFDAGGISIKPAKGMEEEKWDKSGGMAALGILEAITLLAIPVNTAILLCAAENMPGPNSCRPGDVITLRDKTTVEIIDTDAEGRLVLADGMAYANEKFSPELMIDLATLTGAVSIALGDERAGLFTRDNDLAEVFHQSGELTGDRCWRLPLGDDFSADLESTVADLRNVGASRNGGASKAASFLEHFAGDARWVHLDIANTAMPEHDFPAFERGATGAGVLLVAEALRRLYPAG